VLVLEGIRSCIGFRFHYNVIVGNVLEVNEASVIYIPPYNVVFENVILFLLEETLECVRFLLLCNVFVSNCFYLH